jgi:hypothetical protein
MTMVEILVCIGMFIIYIATGAIIYKVGYRKGYFDGYKNGYRNGYDSPLELFVRDNFEPTFRSDRADGWKPK